MKESLLNRGICQNLICIELKFSRPHCTEFGNLRDDVYSARSVIEGSTWAARQAGSQHAMAETDASRAITEM